MSEKFDTLYNTFKEAGLISLYRNRLMVYGEGYGEINYIQFDETEEGKLRFHNSSFNVEFDNYEIVASGDGRPHHIVIEGLLIYYFPSIKKLKEHRDTFYPEEFEAAMSEELSKNENDWYTTNFSQKPKFFLDGAKRNLSQVKTNASKEDIRKAFVDAANYCMMGYYLTGEV